MGYDSIFLFFVILVLLFFWVVLQIVIKGVLWFMGFCFYEIGVVIGGIYLWLFLNGNLYIVF